MFCLQLMVKRYTDEKLMDYNLNTEGVYIPVSCIRETVVTSVGEDKLGRLTSRFLAIL